LSTEIKVQAAAKDLQNLNGEHFIVYYTNDEKFAQSVLRKSEYYYKLIAEELGYGRYADFWIWEKRVKVYVFPDRQSYIEASGMNSWSEGMADYNQKMIVSYVWSEGFLDSLLPHEIAHLIFRDYVGFKGEVPLWLDEGVAQWMEPDKRADVFMVMAQIAEEGKSITLERLMRLDTRKEKDNEAIYIFYVESASLVGYLIRAFGPKLFAEFCRQLRDGKDLKTALTFAYPKDIRTLNQLEEKWLFFIMKEGNSDDLYES
jgi:hypothetical protein